MAITNAQQYKQLLAKGGRIGLKGGADAATESFAKSYDKAVGNKPGTTKGRKGSVNISPSGNVTFDSSGKDSPAQQIIGGKSYPVTPETRDQREMLVEIENERRQQEQEDFITAPANYSKFTPGYAKFLLNLNRQPNRKYLVNKVLKGKNASRIITDALGLDEDGLAFAPSQLTASQLEKVMDTYMTDRMSGKTDAMGNINPSFGRDDGPDQPIIPMTRPIDPGEIDPGEGDDEQTSPGGGRDMGGLAPRFAGSIFDFTGLADGGRVPAMGGGIMNNDIIGGFADGSIDEMGRQMYGLGKLVKKATRGIKKLAKSPIGKAALLYAGGSYLSGTGLFGGLKGAGVLKNPKFLNFMFKDGVPGLSTLTGKGAMAGIGALSALPLLFQGDEEEEQDFYRGPSIDIANIRANPYNFLAPRFQGSTYAADGGRIGYQEGGDAEPVAKKTMPLIDMDGKEKDYRETGGFVDMGRMERADDVPARLSKNEFVFTADAVRNAGEGDIDKGAEVMYNMMKTLEAGGEVSEESQGLEGAREMFKTSQRLEEVL